MNLNNKSDLRILKRIAKESGLVEFWLGGSITYHKAAKDIGIIFDCKDYDLAIKGDEKEYNATKQILKKYGFQIVKDRPYYLKFKKAYQIIAKRGLIHLDIAIVNELSYLGHFNWECIFWHFPSGELYDPYNALNAIKQKRLIPIISPEEENPLILTSRFAKLCARFDIDFCKDKKLCAFAKSLTKLIRKWNTIDSFHGIYAREHAYFGMLQAILRAKERKIFIERLQKSGILNAMFPEISQKLKTSNKVIKGIETATTPEEIVKYLRCFLKDDKKELQHLDKRLALISNRLRKRITKTIKN